MFRIVTRLPLADACNGFPNLVQVVAHVVNACVDAGTDSLQRIPSCGPLCRHCAAGAAEDKGRKSGDSCRPHDGCRTDQRDDDFRAHDITPSP